jgi:hypothetical protein
VNGINSFTFPVPVNAKLGTTYARFRLSFEGGLGPDGPAESGEVEDYLVQIVSAAPPAHPSGLTLVPRGGTTLKSGAGGALEITGLTEGGDDGVTLLAPSNVVSRAAGRIIVPLSPPIPLSAFSSITQPFADGLVLEAHYIGADGQFWTPQLKFMGGDPDRPIIVRAIFGGGYGDGDFLGFTDVSGDGKSDIAHLRADSGDVGSFNGNANIIRLGWVSFPSSALVIFDSDVTFTGVDGTKLSGKSFRFLALDATGKPHSPTALVFTGLSLNGVNLSGGTLIIPDLTVRNPKPPELNSINLQPNGTAKLGFPTEPDVFYSIEATDSLGSPSWKPLTPAYQFGSGGDSFLVSDPLSGKTALFYRLRLE